MRLRVLAAVALMAVLFVGVVAYIYGGVAGARRALVVATTTSLYDTGLLDEVADEYARRYGVRLYFISVGTGLALKHAERGDADAVLVHAPSEEARFLAGGYGGVRKIIAYNFFLIVGPPSDPAGIRGSTPTTALERIAEAGRAGNALWISRGDKSGTHVKERQLWEAAGFNPDELRGESWYVESGTGMGKTLMMASEMEAYTLADAGTYTRYLSEGLIRLDALVRGGRELINVYSVMAVNPNVHPDVNFREAVRFIEFLVSEDGQRLIADFKVDGYTLFYPAVGVLREEPTSEVARWIMDYAFINGSECPPQYRMGVNELYQG